MIHDFQGTKNSSTNCHAGLQTMAVFTPNPAAFDEWNGRQLRGIDRIAAKGTTRKRPVMGGFFGFGKSMTSLVGG